MKIVWSYWELKPGTPRAKIAYYDLIWRTVKAKLDPDTKLILLTPHNLKEYLPELHPMSYRVPHIAQRVDYIRVVALYLYGGIWIDLDTVLMRDLEYFLHLSETYPFVAVNYSVNHFDQQYLWVHDPLMVSVPKGEVITTFYRLFNEFFDDFKDHPERIAKMRYDQSSRLLTESLRKNSQSSYFLLTHNDLDKIPQHLPNIWFKPLNKLHPGEKSILKDWVERCKINICGSAHLFIYLHSHLDYQWEKVPVDTFITDLFERPLGYFLEQAGISPRVDSFTFNWKGLTGKICPYRKLILIDGLHNENEKVRNSLFHPRTKQTEVRLGDGDQYPLAMDDGSGLSYTLENNLVAVSVKSDTDSSSHIQKVEQVFPKNTCRVFPVEKLNLSIEQIAAWTQSIRLVEKVEPVDSEYHGTIYSNMLTWPEYSPSRKELEASITTEWCTHQSISPSMETSNENEVQDRLIASIQSIQYLKAEINHSHIDNKVKTFPFQNGYLVLFDTFSRGYFVARLDGVNPDQSRSPHHHPVSTNSHHYQVVELTHLANLITTRDTETYITTNAHLRKKGMMNTNNDVWIKTQPRLTIIDSKSFEVDLQLVFDRYFKKERYTGYYKRYLVNYRLIWENESWTVEKNETKFIS